MDEGGDQWTHLHYPAVTESGEACAPSRIPLEQLQETRRAIPARMWGAMWMGDPTPATGALFPADGLKEYQTEDLLVSDPQTGGTIDRPLRFYGASDFAVTEGGGDWSVHGVVAADPWDNLYIVDWWRGQVGPDESIDAMIGLMKKHPIMSWAFEKGVIDRSLGPFMQKRMNETQTYIHTVRFPSVADKVVRAQSILGRVSMGKVFFPRHEEWWPPLRQELIRFPHGRTDDQVDVLSLMGRMLAGMIGGRMPPAAPEPGRILTVGGKPTAGYNLMTLNDLWDEEEALRPRRRRRR